LTRITLSSRNDSIVRCFVQNNGTRTYGNGSLCSAYLMPLVSTTITANTYYTN